MRGPWTTLRSWRDGRRAEKLRTTAEQEAWIRERLAERRTIEIRDMEGGTHRVSVGPAGFPPVPGAARSYCLPPLPWIPAAVRAQDRAERYMRDGYWIDGEARLVRVKSCTILPGTGEAP